jgi:hypothetical protein
LVSIVKWQEIIESHGNKSQFRARDLYIAEKAAYVAYESRVREMTYGGQGVIPHDGNGFKTALTGTLELIAAGDARGFNEDLQSYVRKAADNQSYSPLSHGLQAAAGRLATIQAKQRTGAARG